MKKLTLPERIDKILNGKRMSYYDLARALYPGERSWQYQSNGGPPGCFMSLSAGLKRGGFSVSGTFVGERMVYPRSHEVIEEVNNVIVA